MDLRFDDFLDLRGESCPWIVLGCKARLEKLSAGSTLKVLSTDGQAVRDLSNYAKQRGHELKFLEPKGDDLKGVNVCLIKKH